MLMFYKGSDRGKIDYRSLVDDTDSNNSKKTIESIKTMALRTIVGTGQWTLKESIEVALGITPLNYRKKQLTQDYWLKATQDPNIQLPGFR